MTCPGRESKKPKPPQWEASTIEKSHLNSLLIAIRNICIWACDSTNFFAWRRFGSKSWRYSNADANTTCKKTDLTEPNGIQAGTYMVYFKFTGLLRNIKKSYNENITGWQCCGSGMREPGLFWLLGPDGQKSVSGINIPDHISESLVTLFELKHSNSLSIQGCGS
jgi:hypothetical protein